MALYIFHCKVKITVKENESGGWIWWDVVRGSEIRNILSTDYPSASITADCMHTPVYHIIRTPHMNRCWWGAGAPKAPIESIKSEIYVYLYSWITVHHPTRAAEGMRKEEPGYGWQMCYAAGTQVQVGIMSKGRPCGLNSLICCHHTYDESILGSVPLRLPPSRTNWIPNPAIWRPGQEREALWLWPVENGSLVRRAYLSLCGGVDTAVLYVFFMITVRALNRIGAIYCIYPQMFVITGGQGTAYVISYR